MKKYFLIGAILLSGCAVTNFITPQVVTKSLYLNKPLSRFEMDNGFCYAREKTSYGGYINHWKSSGGNMFADALNWDSYPPCRLDLKTNKQNIVTQIKIIEDDIKCAYVLR